MAAIDLARAYISGVNGRDGRRVAALFAADGEIVVPSGQCYRGREAIAAFIEAAPHATTAQVADRTMGTHEVVFHGVVQTPGLAPASVAWHFEVADAAIQRLTIHLENGYRGVRS